MTNTEYPEGYSEELAGRVTNRIILAVVTLFLAGVFLYALRFML